MSNMPEVEHLFTLAASAPVSSLRLTMLTLCVGARPRTAWKVHIISHVQQQTSIMIGVYELLYLAIVWLGMSIFIDYHPQWHAPSTPSPRLHLSHHHNIHITTSTGGRRPFPGLWLFIQVDGYSGKVIMLFRHLQRGG